MTQLVNTECPLEKAYAALGGKGTWAEYCPMPESPGVEDLIDMLRITEDYVDGIELRLKVIKDDAVALRNAILQNMINANTKSTTTTSGTRATVTNTERANVDPKQWDAFIKYVQENNRLDLLTKSISTKNVLTTLRGDKDMGIEGIPLPGVSVATQKTLTVVKKKG